MAKQKKSVAEARRRVRKPAPADEPKQELAATPVVIEKNDVRLDMSISMGDLSEMVATDAKSALIGVRNEVTIKLNGIKAEHAELSKQLQEQAIVVVRGVENDADAKSLSGALAVFHGVPFGITTDDVKISVEDQLVHVDVVVATQASIDERLRKAATKRNDGYGYYPPSFEMRHEKTVSRPFTADMVQIVLDLRKVAQRAADTQVELDRTSHLLADMPNLAARAKSALTKAYLGGELRTGSDMLRVLSNVENVALPAALCNVQSLTHERG